VPNDCIDTDDETWEADVLDACSDHVGHNQHTSTRLKNKLMNRFRKYGGATPRETYGYIKPSGAKTFDQWQKDPAATPIIQQGWMLLKSSLNCSAVADWFNQQGVPVGKYCRRKTWNGAMVRRFYTNPILKGEPGRGFRRTIKHHETGRRISVINAKGPLFRDSPHLAHLNPVDFDELKAELQAKNAVYRRKLVNGTDPRWQMPRKRTRFPGQHACCWYCGRQYVWGGNGVTEHLMCAGSREWQCWNSIGFSGALAVTNIVSAITEELYKLRGFDAQFAGMVQAAHASGSDDRAKHWRALLGREEAQKREKANLMDAIVQFGPRPMLHDKLRELEAVEKELARERQRLEAIQQRKLILPQSVDTLRQLLEGKFQQLASNSPEFGDLMRQLIPNFYVYLVRMVDGGHLLPRAKVTLALGGIMPDVHHVPELEGLLRREVTIDLFEPVQRERIRKEVVHLATTATQRQIITQLPEKATLPAIQRAMAVDRKMRDLGLVSPYLAVLDPPEDYGKLRRHKNPKYRFEPLAGYQPPAL
jgi:hypothetical protein